MEAKTLIDRKTLLVCFSIVFLTFFRAHWAFNGTGFDESCYLEWLHKIIGRPYPACYLKTHFPGVALFWLPASGLAYLFQLLSGTPFNDWLDPFIGLTSFLVWALALVVIVRLYERNVKGSFKGLNAGWAFIFFLAIPSLEFATRRNFTSHSGELLIGMLTLYFLYERKYVWAFIFSIWMTATRINDLPILVMVVGRILDDKNFSFKNARGLLIGAMAVCLFAISGYVVYLMGFGVGHAGVHLADIVRKIDQRSLLLIFMEKDSSLFLFAPVWVLSLILGFLHFRNLSWMARGGIIWMLAVLVFFTGHAGYLTYTGPQLRLFIGTYTAVLCLYFELYKFISKKVLVILIALILFQALTVTALERIEASPPVWSQILQGQFGERYVAHDGSSLSILSRKLILEPIGHSPLFFSIYSGWAHSPVFSRFSSFALYALSGPRLWILQITSLFALCIVLRRILLVFKRTPKVFYLSPASNSLPTSFGDTELSIVMATLNEEENLKQLVPHLLQVFSGVSIEVLIVDGHSTDSTRSVAKNLGCRVVMQEGPSYAWAMKTGVEKAKGKYVIVMDADYSHTPEDTYQLYKNRHQADIIINSRYVTTGGSEAPWDRILFSRFLNWIYRIVLDVPFKEISGGFRLYHREVLAAFSIQSQWYEVQEELLLVPLWLGYTAIELPYTYRSRKEGSSKTRILYFGYRLLLALIRFHFLKSSYASRRSTPTSAIG